MDAAHAARPGPGVHRPRCSRRSTSFDRVAMHAVRRALVTAQAQAAGLPLYAIDLPWPCSTRATNREWPMRCAVSKRTASLTSPSGMSSSRTCAGIVRSASPAPPEAAPLFPLWKTKSTWDLADEMWDERVLSRLPDVCRSTGPGSGIRRPPVRPRPALRPARGRRPVRRERRVPLVRVGRSDVLPPCGSRGRRARDTRRVRIPPSKFPVTSCQ